MQIGVIGSGSCGKAVCEVAFEVGREIARRGAVLVCGGLGGVMEAAAGGARSAGGCTVGILPGTTKADANPNMDVIVVTGMGVARNLLVVRSSDALVAVEGGPGTLSEIAFALQLGVPVVGIGTWKLDAERLAGRRVVDASTPEEAVELAVRAAGEAGGA